jgi:hypothetical protein
MVLSPKANERLQEQLELYAKLAEAEEEIAAGAEGVDFFEFARKLKVAFLEHYDVKHLQ